MKCPGCGGELPPESLFCEKCGYEIHMVPDYDPMDEMTVGEEGAADVPEKKPDDADAEKTAYEAEGSGKRHFRVGLIAVIVCIIIAAGSLAGTSAYRYVTRGNSYTYQLNQGMSYYEEGDYEEAAVCLARALALQSVEGEEGIEVLESLAYSYAYIGENDAAVDCIKEAAETLSSAGADIDSVYAVYQKYMDILNITGQTELVNDVISGCGDQELSYLLYDYRISAPECSEEAGTYSFYLRLELNAEFGNIYYTLDGSEPYGDGTLYESSFTVMDEGETVLRAVAVNKKGIVSPELTLSFLLEFNSEESDESAEY